MNTAKKMAAGTVLGGAMLVAGGFSLAHAAPSVPEAVTGDGKVDVTVNVDGQTIGVLQDVSLANAARLSGSICPTSGIDEAALSRFDNNGTALPGACNALAGGLSYTFSQDVKGAAEAPAQNMPKAPQNAPAESSTQPGTGAQSGSGDNAVAPTTSVAPGR